MNLFSWWKCPPTPQALCKCAEAWLLAGALWVWFDRGRLILLLCSVKKTSNQQSYNSPKASHQMKKCGGKSFVFSRTRRQWWDCFGESQRGSVWLSALLVQVTFNVWSIYYSILHFKSVSSTTDFMHDPHLFISHMTTLFFSCCAQVLRDSQVNTF